MGGFCMNPFGLSVLCVLAFVVPSSQIPEGYAPSSLSRQNQIHLSGDAHSFLTGC